MDRYLEVIEGEKKKFELLEQKSSEIESVNQKRKNKASEYEREENSLQKKIEEYRKRKYYIDNEKKCKKEFLKKAILFGLECGIGIMAVILVLSFFSAELSSVPFFQLFFSFSIISSMLGLVEYRNVSREYSHLVGSYHGNIDSDLELLEHNMQELENKKRMNQEAIEANQMLLLEINYAMEKLNENINHYRTDRNALIESLIENLNSYIVNFEIKEIDIHKVIEKKIQ